MIDIASVPVVYLAGGMRGGWQERVKKAVPNAIYIDPRDLGQTSEAAYTAYDLAGVERSDIVFGYMERTNPGGSGLAVEVAWGVRAGKLVILAEEPGYAQERYFGMVRALVHDRHHGIEALTSAIESLRTYVYQGREAFFASRQG